MDIISSKFNLPIVVDFSYFHSNLEVDFDFILCEFSLVKLLKFLKYLFMNDESERNKQFNRKQGHRARFFFRSYKMRASIFDGYTESKSEKNHVPKL